METRGKKSEPAHQIKQSHLLKRCFLLPVYLYRYLISPLLGPRCRFDPTCSFYAEQAVMKHGVLKGSVLAVRRLLKCHPWHHGGYDPVPPKNQKSHSDD